jgi:hypothetical protein
MTSAARPLVPPSLVRRVLRVRERFDMHPDHLDELFDDFVVLWRAFESTVEGADHKARRAEDAVVETVGYARGRAQARGADLAAVAPRLLAWCRELRLFQRLHDGQLAQWLGEEELTAVQGHEIRTRLARLSSAVQVPERWTDRDSRDAGWTLYRLRCAVFHASVETSDSVALRIAPLTCAALIELGVLRAAFISRGEVAEAWRLLGGPDDL